MPIDTKCQTCEKAYRLPDNQRRIQIHMVGHTQRDPRLPVSAEPCFLHGQRVLTGRQTQQMIFAAPVRLARRRNARLPLRRRHPRAEHRKALRIPNLPGELPVSRLRKTCRADQQQPRQDSHVKKGYQCLVYMTILFVLD